jgi:hypothetical protein
VEEFQVATGAQGFAIDTAPAAIAAAHVGMNGDNVPRPEILDARPGFNDFAQHFMPDDDRVLDRISRAARTGVVNGEPRATCDNLGHHLTGPGLGFRTFF